MHPSQPSTSDPSPAPLSSAHPSPSAIFDPSKPSVLADQRFRTQCLRAAPCHPVVSPKQPIAISPRVHGQSTWLVKLLVCCSPPKTVPDDILQWRNNFKPQIARLVHPIHSPKGRVFKIGYDNKTRERIRSRIFQIIRISTKTSTRPATYKFHILLAALRKQIVVHSHKIKPI